MQLKMQHQVNKSINKSKKINFSRRLIPKACMLQYVLHHHMTFLVQKEMCNVNPKHWRCKWCNCKTLKTWLGALFVVSTCAFLKTAFFWQGQYRQTRMMGRREDRIRKGPQERLELGWHWRAVQPATGLRLKTAFLCETLSTEDCNSFNSNMVL